MRRHTGAKILRELTEDSATGPDQLAARILKRCADALSIPFAKLGRAILKYRRWPRSWMIHWILALHKRKSVYDPSNYRGIHLTAQISKAMERYLGSLFLPALLSANAFGENQFAYTPKRGARDAVLYYVLSWILALNYGMKIAIYCSDVSGAFDRISTSRMMSKLEYLNLNHELLAVIASWLEARTASVVVNGIRSSSITLHDMVYQGTVWGPTLWNCFYGDACYAIRGCDFEEIIYADDLNSFKYFDHSVSNETIFDNLKEVQSELYTWGRANQVTFDAGKEHFMIVSNMYLVGEPITILGILFDNKLLILDAIYQVACETS